MSERRQRPTPDESQRLHAQYEELQQTHTQDLQRLAQLGQLQAERDLTDAEDAEYARLNRAVEARKPRIEAAGVAAAQAKRQVNVAAIQDEWPYEAKRQAYVDFFAGMASARTALGTIVSITNQQCDMLAEEGVSSSEINMSSTGVTSNIASRQRAAQAWHLLLNDPSGPLPMGSLEETMDPDPGTKPLSAAVFNKVLGPVA